MITVYHEFKFRPESTAKIVAAVAHVRTNSMQEAYRLTSGICWGEDVDVIGKRDYYRATSAGDVLMDSHGSFYVIEQSNSLRLMSPKEINDMMNSHESIEQYKSFRLMSPKEINDMTFYTISA
jgi:hypothetical protein